jgi:hypothetical protein
MLPFAMSSSYESADLLLKLYELRREPTMREARDWYFREFNPTSIDEVMQTVMGQHSAHFRMVISYWDMAASFVANGAIDEQMFNDANGEQVGIFAKIEPFIGEYRQKMGNPNYLVHLEKLVTKRPGAKEMMASLRERFRAMAASR